MSGPVVVEKTLEDLVAGANEAMDRMGARNPHRRVVWELGNALVALGDRYANLEAKHERVVRELEQLTAMINQLRKQEERDVADPPIVVP